MNLTDNFDAIIEVIKHTPSSEISEYWGTSTSEKRKYYDWILLISEYAKTMPDAKHLNIESIFKNII